MRIHDSLIKILFKNINKNNKNMHRLDYEATVAYRSSYKIICRPGKFRETISIHLTFP